jgi:HlyD family secretion protein
MLVYTKTDESDVGNIKPGKPVTFKVDAFPKDTFHGVVSQVRMNPTTVQSVVTYDTIIEFANPELKLFPGMTAYVTIPVATVQNVVKVPNTALRYKPPMGPEEILAVYKQYGIEGSDRQLAGDDPAVTGRGPQAGGENQNLPRAPRAENAVVWKLHADNTMEPVKVSLGITDHAYTQVTALIKGELKDGDALIIRSVMPKTQAPGTLRR